MSRIILDAELRAKLNGLSEPLELCDEGGKTLGHYLPEVVYNKMLYALAEAQRPPLSEEEIEQRRKETGGSSLAEIWKRLGVS
jgi:hypothetical protein